jgi:hypothetical protein
MVDLLNAVLTRTGAGDDWQPLSRWAIAGWLAF